MFDRDNEDREQRYEYKLVSSKNRGGSILSWGSKTAESTFNKLAQNGWQYKEDIKGAKGTIQLIFERPVDSQEQ